jgi:hypothetical protein
MSGGTSGAGRSPGTAGDTGTRLAAAFYGAASAAIWDQVAACANVCLGMAGMQALRVNFPEYTQRF